MDEYFVLHVFLFLDSTLFRFDSTFWFDSTLKPYYEDTRLTDVLGYCVLDIVLVVDTSSSIREFQPPNVVNKELIINFLSELVNRPLEVGEYYDHVGVVTFASSARTLFDLRLRTSVEELRRGFTSLPDPNGETNTPDAINLALQVSRLFSAPIFSRSYYTRGPHKDW